MRFTLYKWLFPYITYFLTYYGIMRFKLKVHFFKGFLLQIINYILTINTRCLKKQSRFVGSKYILCKRDKKLRKT